MLLKGVKARSKKPRRSVTLCNHVSKGKWQRTGHVALWAFGYADLAALFGVNEGAVRMMVQREQLDPRDLESVCRVWATRLARAQAREIAPR